MLNCFIIMTKTAPNTSLPITFSQIILGKDHTPSQIPKK
jgi:hypothetical protein